MILNQGEVIDDLGIKDYKIIQSNFGFKFGIDAVLLANFVVPKKNDNGVDLGSGTGIIPMIIEAKSQINSIVGIEIQKEVCDMSIRTSILNGNNNKVSFLNIDVKEVPNFFSKHSMDFVTSNPPYYKINTLYSPNISKNISRHEVLVTIEDIFKISNYLLKPQKHLYIIHKPERLVELIEVARKNKLEPKEIQFVFPKSNKAPNLILIKYTKNANSGIKYRQPIFVYNDDGSFSDDIKYIYNNKYIGE